MISRSVNRHPASGHYGQYMLLLFVTQYVTGISVSGMRLDANQLSTLCIQLSSLERLTSLSLSNNTIDLMPQNDDHSAVEALCSLLSALSTLRHLDLSDVCMTGCLDLILTSISSPQLVRLDISEQWLNAEDLTALQQFQWQTTVAVTFN